MMKLCVSIGLVDVLLVSCGLRRRCVQRLDGFPQVRGDSIRQTCVFRGFQKSHFLLGMLQENRNKLETEGTWCHGFPIKRPTALLASMWQFFGNPLKPIFCFRDFMGGLKGKAFEMSFCVVWSMIINWFGLVWVFGSFGGRSWEATWVVVDPP